MTPQMQQVVLLDYRRGTLSLGNQIFYNGQLPCLCFAPKGDSFLPSKAVCYTNILEKSAWNKRVITSLSRPAEISASQNRVGVTISHDLVFSSLPLSNTLFHSVILYCILSLTGLSRFLTLNLVYIFSTLNSVSHRLLPYSFCLHNTAYEFCL